MSEISRKNFFSLDTLLDFSLLNPGEIPFPEPLLRRFLTELVSGAHMIFDLHDAQGRAAVAVLLDKVNNPANDACLEILGMREGADKQALIARAIDLARESQPENRAGFQWGFPEKSAIDAGLLSEKGLEHYYDTFTMRFEDLRAAKIQQYPEIRKAVSEDAQLAYELLRLSFAQNPEASIPDLDAWKSNFLKSKKSHYYFWVDKPGTPVAFMNLLEGEDNLETEINTIGVLPNARRLGIGEKLLQFGLSESARMGFQACHLAVAVKNEGALGLYLRAGFVKQEKFLCFHSIRR
jgi:ribosomal protein S18 acetylase RimI-like enzyme